MKQAAELLQIRETSTWLTIRVDGLIQVDARLEFELIWPKPEFVSRTLDKYRKRTSARLTHPRAHSARHRRVDGDRQADGSGDG